MVSDYVSGQCTQFDQEAVDAALKKSGGSFEVVPGQTGIVLDTEGAAAVIHDYIENEWVHTDGEVELPVKTDEPRGTAEELGKVKDELGTFTTSYKT